MRTIHVHPDTTPSPSFRWDAPFNTSSNCGGEDCLPSLRHQAEPDRAKKSHISIHRHPLDETGAAQMPGKEEFDAR